MRIIAGKFRRRQLVTPPDALTTRPIPDRVKESLFSLLRGHFEGATVLDAFAGTGAIGLEAISRGAERVVFVEQDRRAAGVLEANIRSLGCEDQSQVVRGDALGPSLLARCPSPLNLAFFDPPYPLVLRPGEEGWERVRRQFMRVIDLMTYEGFAVLRTPWPFRHVVGETAAPVSREGVEREGKGTETGGKHDKRGRAHRRRQERHSAEREWIGADLDWRAIQEESRRDEQRADEDDEQQEAAPEAVERVDVDLTMPNALVPETHVYAGMGVHLYMRKRPAGDGVPATGAAPSGNSDDEESP